MIDCKMALVESMKRTVALVSLCMLAVPASAGARRKKPQSEAVFSYYLLSLSYAPDFCAQPTGNKDVRECGTGRRVGFVVHGLWPQIEGGRGPEDCGSASPVSQEIVRLTLAYIPTESLIQHEWATHGTCTGLSSSDYFALVRRARDLVKIPDDFKTPARQMQLGSLDIESKFAAANPNFPRGAFRLSCYRDTELQEVRIALNKDLSPRPYGSGGGSCGRTILMNPVR
jgi:ribonuclease T2